eukprot:COSAG05_NODE_275_length_12406_cov_12.621841_8_plen_49_part_00
MQVNLSHAWFQVRDHAQSKMDEHQKLAAHKMIVQHFVLHRPNRVQVRF